MGAKMIIDNDNREMFEVFCNLHPIEAYHLNPKEFCKYYRSFLEGSDVAKVYTDKKIKELINEAEADIK
jgi:hypothetical protein